MTRDDDIIDDMAATLLNIIHLANSGEVETRGDIARMADEAITRWWHAVAPAQQSQPAAQAGPDRGGGASVQSKRVLRSLTTNQEAPMAHTSPAQDVQALHDAVVATVRTSAYDDMSWPEIDRALVLASHTLKVLFMKYGTLDQGTIDAANPPPDPLARHA